MRHGLEPRRRRGVAALAGALVGGLVATAAQQAAAAPTPAAPRVIAWSTYLRDGPAQTYTAIAELEHDTPVQVLSCGGGWCRVSGATGSGYVDADALDLPRTLAPQPPANTDCVVVGQADNRGPIPTRFCSASPRPQ